MNLYTSCLFFRGNTIKTSGSINVVLSFSLMAGQISFAARNLGVRHISWKTPQIPSPNIPYTMYICDPFNLNFVGIGGFLFRTDSYRFYGYFCMSMEKGRVSGMGYNRRECRLDSQRWAFFIALCQRNYYSTLYNWVGIKIRRLIFRLLVKDALKYEIWK